MGDLAAVRHPLSELSILSRTSIPGSPDWVKASGSAVWVSNLDGDEVVRIAPATGDVVDRIMPGRRPCSGLGIGFDSVWVPSCADAHVARIDSRTNAIVATIPLRIADSEGALTCSARAVWVPAVDGVLCRVDPTSNAIVARIDVGAGGFCAAAGHGSVWVTNTRDSTLIRIDEEQNRVSTRLAVGPSPRFLAVTTDAVWTLNQGDGTVSRVDPVTSSVVATIELGTPGPGGDIAAGLGAVWTTAVGTPLSRIDPATNRVVAQYVGRGGDALTVGHGFLWICSFFLQELWKVAPPKP